MEAIAIRLKAIARWRPSLLGWRRSHEWILLHGKSHASSRRRTHLLHRIAQRTSVFPGHLSGLGGERQRGEFLGRAGTAGWWWFSAVGIVDC